jgi:NADH-quinone oxidoreductase subunit M
MSWPKSTLSVLVWTPALGAFLLLFVRDERLRRRIAFGFPAFSLAVAAALALTFDPDASLRELHRWIPQLGLAYDLDLDGFSSLLIVWISLLALVATASADPSERHVDSQILLAETALLGLALAGDGVLLLSFYGAGLLSTALLLRGGVLKIFLVFQSAGAALAVVSIAVSYHLAWIQTGFPSAEIARFSSLVTFPDFQARMLLLGAAVVAFAGPLFPFTSWVKTQGLAREGSLLLLGGWSLVGTLFFSRAVLPAYSGGGASWLPSALAALSLVYAGLASRLSWVSLLVGTQGLVVLGLLSPAAEGAAAGRAGMMQLAIALSAIAIWASETVDRGPRLTSAIAIAMFLPVSWLVLRARWNDAPALAALAALGLALMMFHAARSLPPLDRRRGLLLFPLVALWLLTFLAPSRFLPEGSVTVPLEEE